MIFKKKIATHLLLVFALIPAPIGVLTYSSHTVAPAVPIESVDTRASRIDEYFASKNMPLAGYGKKFVEAADKYGIEDWGLLPAISVAESSGGKHMCKNNPFGWASCKRTFDSIDQAIDYVTMNLGGHNPRTKSAYNGDTQKDLYSYNGSVEPGYPKKVTNIMLDIMDL